MGTKGIAQFGKVSFEQFKKDCIECGINMTEEEYVKTYNSIKIPSRATKGSAGYDFYAPKGFVLSPGQSIKFPTGINVTMVDGWVLKLYPRSGHGFKYRLQLDNTVGIIDQDYYFSDNEGHIHCKLTNDGKEGKLVKVKAGEAYMQGIFSQYGTTVDDDATAIRNGGFGSTTKQD